MPVEIEKEMTTTSDGTTVDRVSQTATVEQAPTRDEEKEARSDRGNPWVWYIVAIIDLGLLLRFLFHLFGARTVGFTDFLYSITGLFIAPFRGIFSSPTIEGSSFDLAALLAIIMYLVFGWMITRLIDLVTRPTDSEKL